MEIEPVYFFKTIQADAKRVVLETLEHALRDQVYHPVDAQKWTQSLPAACLQRLQTLADGAAGFKFVVHLALLQKKNGGVHTSSACAWNADTDGQVVVRYETPTLVAIATVYALSLA
ncbi:hypothetical protein SDRG_02856 [Saprolegnia diclina VS20]|uniref:Dynein light chain Tctex-type 1 n=1 Tax=Saprolegnia diclina (strain VS20) TaxID=1156394 RepID=T0S513_SAPDV|nr:hypothetical protein SDRG_02856 [Saprolegnia diclina VS20]EQC40208.1 hypothetical protein SDRG_02856 [Saprolegnia diclina VS20]|eukprot:XP_008606682.1 hypothetical protein SDRG_02856 [Saprolegnia diclina VS20]